VRDAAHNSNYKLVKANIDDDERTGSLEPLARSHLIERGTVFVDEYDSQQKKQDRGFSLLGEDVYTVYFVRSRYNPQDRVDDPGAVQWVETSSNGDDSGLTPNDALAGARALRDITLKTPHRMYMVGEMFNPESASFGPYGVGAGGEVYGYLGLPKYWNEVRWDWAEFELNGYTFDRSVWCGGWIMDREWINNGDGTWTMGLGLRGGTGRQRWLFNPGSFFGHPVDKTGYKQFLGRWGTSGRSDVLEKQAADGCESVLIEVKSHQECVDTPYSVYFPDGAGTGNRVTTNVNGAHPRGRVVASDWGYYYNVGGDKARWFQRLIGIRARIWYSRYWNSFTEIRDFSVKFNNNSGRGSAIAFHMGTGQGDSVNINHFTLKDGYMSAFNSGYYSVRGGSDAPVLSHVVLEDWVAESFKGTYADETGTGDRHAVGSQGAQFNTTVKKLIVIRANINFYHQGTTEQDWGRTRFDDIDINGVAEYFSKGGSDSGLSGIEFGGDSQIDIGTSGIPLSDYGDDIEIRNVRVRNCSVGWRTKVQNNSVKAYGFDIDQVFNACVRTLGESSGSPNREPQVFTHDFRYGAKGSYFYGGLRNNNDARPLWQTHSNTNDDFLYEGNNNTYVGAVSFAGFEGVSGTQTLASWQTNTLNGGTFDPDSVIEAE
jgi:hypothetical protein